MAELWSELGLEPTGDAAAIRRAYAARLKQTRPEEERDGFMRLRAAYEAALAMAATPPMKLALSDFPHAKQVRDVAAPEPLAASNLASALGKAPVREVAGEGVALSRVTEALARRDVIAAAAALVAGRETSDLSLADEIALADRLLLLMRSDWNLPGPAVLDASMRLGWDVQRHSTRFNRLQARIKAERWLLALKSKAASYSYYFSGQRAAAARLMLGRGRITLSRLVQPEPLRRLLAEFHLHQAWVAPAFDAPRIAAVERIAQRGIHYTGVMSYLGGLLLLACLAGSNPEIVLLLYIFIAVVRPKHLRRTLLALTALVLYVTLSALVHFSMTWLHSIQHAA